MNRTLALGRVFPTSTGPAAMLAAFLGAGLAVPFVVLTAMPATGADLVIEGCSALSANEVGVEAAIGDVGDLLSVAVTVNATTSLRAFQVDLDFPPGSLSYLRTDEGQLTSSFAIVGGAIASSRVRISGADLVGLPAGSMGSLAVVVFRVVAPGAGTFGISGLLGDLAGYGSCEDAGAPTHILSTEWGSIKALYRP